jgi:HEAT repeat protein
MGRKRYLFSCKDWHVREGAAKTLGWIGPGARDATPALIQTLADENQNVNTAAILALSTITEQDFGRDAAAWQVWWEKQ